MSANGVAAGSARDRVLERAFDVVERVGEDDGAAVHLGIEAGPGAELRQLVDRDVDLHRAAARLPLRDRGDEVVGELGSVDLVEERDLRMRRGDDDVGAQLFARVEHDTARASVLHIDARDARVGAHRRAERLGRVAQRARHAAHAAAREAPVAHLAVADVTDLVMRHHVRGARRTRPGPRADDAAHREHALHLR